jgi:hypothetical protein
MNHRVASAILLAAFVAACGTYPTGTAIVLQGATIIEPRDGTHVSDGVIVIDSGRIVAAGASREVSVPRGVTTIDLRGKYVFPASAIVEDVVRPTLMSFRPIDFIFRRCRSSLNPVRPCATLAHDSDVDRCDACGMRTVAWARAVLRLFFEPSRRRPNCPFRLRTCL